MTKPSKMTDRRQKRFRVSSVCESVPSPDVRSKDSCGLLSPRWSLCEACRQLISAISRRHAPTPLHLSAAIYLLICPCSKTPLCPQISPFLHLFMKTTESIFMLHCDGGKQEVGGAKRCIDDITALYNKAFD